MCGIFSVYQKNQKVDHHRFSEALSLLNHRGPDEKHYEVLENPHQIAFGHTRLSIIGVESGKQPLIYKDQFTSIINGEFYDYKEIRASYEKKGYQFHTKTDSEIILPMYLDYGLDCFSKLNGEFAGVIYDQENEKIIAFRDRHGVKPLYFRQSVNGISFSSEIKSILNYEKIKPEFNLRELKDKLYFHPWDQDATVFKDIYNVKPGHFLIYDIKTGDVTQKSYWQVNYNKENYTNDSLDQILSTYQSKIVKAIERRLVADVPVASYLSGGIDSSICYGVASQLMGKGLDAFTISFDDKAYDEKILAEKLVKKYSGHQYILDVTDQMLVDNLKNHFWSLEGIAFNPHGIAKHLLSQLVRDNGYKVVITGEGSDEYNCGYITNVIDAMKVNPEQFDVEAIKSKIEVNRGAFLADGAKDISFIEKYIGSNLSMCSNSVPQMQLINSLLTDACKDDVPEEKFKRFFTRHKMNIKNWDFLNISLYYQSLSTFAYVLTTLGDRTEMAHSVEARVPFLDNDVIDFITKVPPKYKYYNNTDKYILRESCREFVTNEHYQNMKHPYLAPPSKKDSMINQLIADSFNSQKFKNIGIFDTQKLQNLLQKHVNAETVDPFLSRVLFCILSVAQLNEIFDFSM